ncbi:precorrin-6Y C5,15-methyltransferase (decarboxylating) subunit CbiT, partial [Frisingicoccus sp.]|uniref:precorrin-6Y C5,15-methyltransferase (decarboxylating) subunit CbiT n=1 Tax=Frisingicoccus sp. TaxID=1918627 RepID=UPI003993C9B9
FSFPRIVRWIILGKLNLSSGSVLWDVGAGTGSVSIECARHCPLGKVIAVEKNPKALEILYENRKQLASDNMEIIEGAAPEALEGLERPTHVFVGGAGRALKGILKALCQKGPGIKVVIACVTLETMIEACQLAETMEGLEKTELLTIRIEKERPVGSYHLMEGGHPVTLLIARTCGGQEE